MKKNKKDYNEYEYWNKRKYPNNKKQTSATLEKHINYIKVHLADANKILDFGSGIGRTFSAYTPGQIIIGCDISTLYAKKVIKKSKQLGLDFELKHITMEDMARLPYDSKSFDVAVSSQVFLHQKPENIIKIMKELCRIAKKVIVISWMDKKITFDKVSAPAKAKTRHCFNYNYPEICEENGWDIFDIEFWMDKQILFCYKE